MALDEQLARLEDLTQEIIGLEAELERLRSLQQAREKDRVALDHEMRKLGEDLSRANSRLSVARLELERLRRDAEKSAEQREHNRAAVAEKERLRAEQRRGARSRAQRAREAGRPGARPSAEEHSAMRAELAGLEERHRGERAAMARLEQQFRETTNRRNAIAPEIERLGEQRARLLADNIELDRKAAQLAEQIHSSKREVEPPGREETGMREALRSGEEELKVLRAAGAGAV